MRVRALLAGLLLLAGCSRHEAARPALWRVSDGDTTLYLLGTVHLVPPDVDWRTPAIERAIDESRELVLEVPPAPAAQDAAAFDRLAHAKDLPPLAARVPANQRDALNDAVARAGTDEATLDGMKTWAAVAMLGNGDARATGATREAAPEPVLAAVFRRAGKPIAALETTAGQLATLDALSEPAERAMLAATLADRGGYRAILTAWERGDVASLAKVAETQVGPALEAERALVFDRNRRWTGWIARQMRRPGTLMMAVGAGHLVGRDALPAMLARAGYAVKRVE